jgi:hypothetical protein
MRRKHASLLPQPNRIGAGDKRRGAWFPRCVIAALDPAIHPSGTRHSKWMDTRVKPAYDSLLICSQRNKSEETP